MLPDCGWFGNEDPLVGKVGDLDRRSHLVMHPTAVVGFLKLKNRSNMGLDRTSIEGSRYQHRLLSDLDP